MKRSLRLALLAFLPSRLPHPPKCDDLDPAVCLQPFPNNFTTPAAGSATGLRVHFTLSPMPRNVAGKPIQPALVEPQRRLLARVR
jgi:hypothetical protein